MKFLKILDELADVESVHSEKNNLISTYNNNKKKSKNEYEHITQC